MGKRRRLLDAVADKEEEKEEEEGKEEDFTSITDAMTSDVEAAILFLRNEMRSTCPQLPPLVCYTQLCSMIHNRTSLERGLDECRKKNILRMFKLSTGADEHGVLLLEDYVDCIYAASTAGNPWQGASAEHLEGGQEQQQQALAVQQQQQQRLRCAVAWNFCTNALPNHPEVSISKTQLMHLLSSRLQAPQPVHHHHHQQQQQQQGHQQQQQQGHQQQQHHIQQQQQHAGPGRPPAPPYPATELLALLQGTDADKQTSILLNLGQVEEDNHSKHLLKFWLSSDEDTGVLSRHPADDGAFLMSVPGLGPVIKGIIAGRKELMRIVSRKQYKEMPESQLLGTSTPASNKRSTSDLHKEGAQGVRLRGTSLGTSFHLRDLLGKGKLQRVRTASGTLIRAAQQ